MTILGLTAEQVAVNGKGWVEAIAQIVGAIIAQIGILGLALLGAFKTLRQQIPQEIVDRLDRQGKRIDDVAMNSVPVGAIKAEALEPTRNGNAATVAEAIQPEPPPLPKTEENVQRPTSNAELSKEEEKKP